MLSITENSDVLESLISLIEEHEKRVDALEKKMDIIEEKITNNSIHNELSKIYDSPAVKKPVARSILVVDDDKKLASSFKLILESAGYIVDIANTGFSALIKTIKNTYDLVLLDWHLHDIFGDKVAEKIEKNHSGTKIIFITGYSYLLDDYDRENEILMKPIDPEYLLETVAKTIA
jgi:CheY-like chemotaxis protein